MYNTVEKLLENNNNEIIQYDFKNEAPWINVRQKHNPIEKFKCYKENNKKLKNKFDCDNSNGTCSLTNDIYVKLWNWSFDNRYYLSDNLYKSFNHVWNRLGSDTMNSFSTSYNQAIKIYGSVKAAEKNPLLKKFASLTHTIGNFTLIPFKLSFNDQKSFNQYRGANFGKYFVYDYFDLSLKLIKENVDETTFHTYIDTFFLNDYVDNNYNIKPLCSSHMELLQQEKLPLDKPEIFLPKTEEELNEYLNNVLTLIQARGNRIVMELRKKVNIQKPNTNNPFSFTNKIKRSIKIFALETLILDINLFILIYLSSTILGEQSPMLLLINNTSNGFGKIIMYLLFAILMYLLSMGLNFILLIFKINPLYKLHQNLKTHQCLYCNRMFALNEIDKNLVKTENISILVETKDRNADGSIDKIKEQYVPGIRKHYTSKYKCKYCNTESIRNYTIDQLRS